MYDNSLLGSCFYVLDHYVSMLHTGGVQAGMKVASGKLSLACYELCRRPFQLRISGRNIVYDVKHEQ